MKTFREGQVMVFHTTDSRFRKYNGEFVKIEKVYDRPDLNHDREVLPMYDVRLESGEQIHVFDDELVPA